MKNSYLYLLVIMQLISGCTNKSRDFTKLEDAVTQWRAGDALSLIRQYRNKMSDSLHIANLDLYEMEVYLMQRNTEVLTKKIEEFDSKTSLKVKYHYRNKWQDLRAAAHYDALEYDLAREQYARILDLAIQRGNWYREAFSKLKIDFCNIRLKNQEMLSTHSESARVLAEKHDNQYLLGEYYHNLGFAFFLQRNSDSCRLYFTKAEDHFRASNHVPMLIKLKNHLGVNYRISGSNVSAFNQYKEGLELSEKIGDLRSKTTFNRNLGILYAQFKAFDKARNHLQQAAEPQVINLIPNGQFQHYGNMGDIEFLQGNYQEALTNYRTALSMANMDSSLHPMRSIYLYNVGECYYNLQEYDLAKETYQEAQELQVDEGKNYIYYHIMTGMGRVAAAVDPTTQTIDNCKESWEHGLATNNLNLKKDACECLYKSYQKIGDNRNANQYMETYYKLEREAYETDMKNDLGFIENEYLNKQKILEAKLQVQEQLVIAEKRQRKLHLSYLTIGFILLSCLIIFWTLWSQSKKKAKIHHLIRRKNQELYTLNKEVKKKNSLLNKQNMQLDAQLKNNLLTLTGINNMIKRLQELVDSMDLNFTAKGKIKSVLWSHSKIQEVGNVEEQFLECNQRFVSELLHKCPDLTPNAVKLCVMIKLGLSNQEISSIKQATPESIKIAKNRLRKKLVLEKDVKLFTFFNHISKEPDLRLSLAN